MSTKSPYTCPTSCVERNHPGCEHEEWIDGQRKWLCDVYDEPTTCLTVHVPLGAACRPCRARAADRLFDALRTLPTAEPSPDLPPVQDEASDEGRGA